jgi:phenylacetate-CoA ligase
MTSLEIEREEQQRWRLRPEHAAAPWFDRLLENEFLTDDELRRQQSTLLTSIVRFAAGHVPYYRDVFARGGLDVADITGADDLVRLPVLGKQDVVRHSAALLAGQLPPGHRLTGSTQSSGTTGAPLSVASTQCNDAMFTFLWQRQARWFRLDPRGILVDIRTGKEIGRQPDGSPNSEGAVVRHPRWRYLGEFFETGPQFGFNSSNVVERQLAWLRQIRPQALHTYPGVFEELALGNEGRPPVDSLEALVGIGSQLTPALRTRLESIYGLPIHQTYGLNEIGKVGLRCNAGRYHVHAEHCVVEIVDGDGMPCPPGTTGRVLVTALRNYAMPLLRYDTGDLAEAVAGRCPCGRTLPSFGEVAGRFRRYHGLPAGTRERVHGLLGALANVPVPLLDFLREYQIHQDREDRFTLRLKTVGPAADQFTAEMQRAWLTLSRGPHDPLAIRIVDHIPRSPSGKHLDFTSDMYDDDYARTIDQDRTDA